MNPYTFSLPIGQILERGQGLVLMRKRGEAIDGVGKTPFSDALS
jgi:hypothetical protein